MALARRARLWLSVIFIVVSAFATTTVRAGQAVFRTYNADQGLDSLGGDCLIQDWTGFILVCTENGVFFYDGRRFENLGKEQGLRDGGNVYDVAIAASGQIAVRFADEVLISTSGTDNLHSPRTLTFETASHPGLSFYDASLHRLVAWHDGFALLAGETLEKIVLSAHEKPRVEVIAYGPMERAQLAGATEIFSIDGHLWVSFEDERLCTADPGQVKCYGRAEGLQGGSWISVVKGQGGQIFARSTSSVALFDPDRRQWSLADLPDQGGRYRSYATNLGIFKAPDGSLITQADHGLAILGPRGWRAMSVQDGAPTGTIVSAITDSTGQLWFQVFGEGLKRWVSYGRWETFQKFDGLSEGIAWKTARIPGGALWISTDTGVDEVVRDGGGLLKLSRVLPTPSYAIATDSLGRLWFGNGKDGVEIVDPQTGARTAANTPAVNIILPLRAGEVWLGTRKGLFRTESRPGSAFKAELLASAGAEVVDVAGDGSGGAYYLSGGCLRHFRLDGSDVQVVDKWPAGGFEPIVLAKGHDGAVWVGGAGGLFRVALASDRLSSIQTMPLAAIRSNDVVAMLVDHRNWVWIGTPRGVSVFNGQKWMSIDSESGLVADDVNQGGIREDPDGSLWITTAEGVSHLLNPNWLFTPQEPRVVLSDIALGSHTLNGKVPFSKEALTIRLGTSTYGSERSITFRYRLSGVDASMVESSSGQIRYPVIPPGHHVLTVTGLNEMTHQASSPTSFVIDVAYPWWRQWWAEAAWALSAIALAYGSMRLRIRVMLNRQAELERHVAQATERLRYDELTGLLNRREIEKRIACKLAGKASKSCLMVALLDIDYFKQVNDSHGHLGGDDVLRQFGQLVRTQISEGEYAGRYGGEEILLVLNDNNGRGAGRVLHLLHAIRGTPFNAAGTSIKLTCSIGVAWATHGDDWETLVGRADAALYDAKALGRDRVVEKGNCDDAPRKHEELIKLAVVGRASS